MPLYSIGDALPVKDGLYMRPGVVTASSETYFDEVTITMVISKEISKQRRTSWQLSERMITSSFNIAPVNFSSVL